MFWSLVYNCSLVFGILLWRCLLYSDAYDSSACSTWLHGSNGVRRDVWTSIQGGFFLKHLKEDRRFIKNILFSTYYLKNIEAPKNYSVFYGQRLTAYFVPNVTGNYTFVATCDSECEIFLSSTEDSNNKRTIIYIDQYHKTEYDEWNKHAVQRSCPQLLERQVIYYIEALHSNFKDNDHVRVRIVYPGQTLIKVIEETQLIRYSDTPLSCNTLRSLCGFLCEGGSETIIRQIDPKTKLCTINTTVSGVSWTTAPTVATTVANTTQPTSNPLLNITTRSETSTTMEIFWHFKNNYVPGSGILQYRLNYNKISSSAIYSTIVSGNITAVKLTGLKKFTLYCIRILFIARGVEGKSNGCTYGRTKEDVPSRPPQVLVKNKAMKSIVVIWQPLQQQHRHGILKGYKIHISNMNGKDVTTEVIKIETEKNYTTVHGMQKGIQYCVRVLAFTGQGDGPYSRCTSIVTWTDDMLPKMRVHNYTTISSMNITWNTLPGYLRGHVIAYRLSYAAIESEGEVVEQPIKSTINVTVNTTTFSIANLKIFSVYRIEVRPLTRQGIGKTTHVAYGATCRCKPYLNAVWSPVPPYAVKTHTGSPSGLIPKLLTTMVDDSCGFCSEYNQSKIIYRLKSSRITRDIIVKDEKADFVFPIRKSDLQKFEDSEVYIPLLEVPGFAFLTSVKTNKAYARQVATSVFNCWPILVISLCMTLLSGVVLWLLELVARGNHQSRKHRSFHDIFDGVWWSFITMTTVGYGDKIPHSNSGRLFAIIWLFIGVVTVALMVGSITSSMSVKILKEQMFVKRDKKIASVEDPLDYKVLMNVDERASTRTTYVDIESLIDALKVGRTEGIIVDMYMAGFRTDLFNGSWYKVASILDEKFYYGVSISGNAATLVKKFQEHSKKTYEIEIKLLQEERHKETVSNQFYVHSQTIRKDIDLLNPKTLIYRLTVILLFTVLGCSIIIGMLAHSWKRNRDREKKHMKQVTIPRDRYRKIRQELKIQLETFYKQFLATYIRLKIKHRQEMLEYLKYKKARQHEVIWL